MLDWNQCQAVERVLGKVSGAWVFKHTRVPVKALFENLEDGDAVALLVRPEFYETNEKAKQELSGVTELIIAKRRNGPTGELSPQRFTKANVVTVGKSSCGGNAGSRDHRSAR